MARMIVRDPNYKQLAEICRNENTADEFAKANGLLPVVQQNQPCVFKPNCPGILRERTIRGI